MKDFNRQTSHYILGVDGGGTKTLARLEQYDDNFVCQKIWFAKGGPCSLTNNFDGAVAVIKKLSLSLSEQAHINSQQIVAVFGLAGAGNDIKVAKLLSLLNTDFGSIQVVSDAKTSLYGANLGKPTIAIALGTGSVGMRLNEKGDETLFGGWGFKLGDDGSGAKLGINAIKASLAEIEFDGELKSALTQEVCAAIGHRRTDILQWLSAANADDFARFAPLVFKLSPHCPQAQEVLEQHIEEVETLICCGRSDNDLPIILLGGLAAPSKKMLSLHAQQLLSEAKGDALDGACLLAKNTAMLAITPSE
jgi:glucosamine kinase